MTDEEFLDYADALRQKATQGPWTQSYARVDMGDGDGYAEVSTTYGQSKIDAAYIAEVCSPDVVGRLIELARRGLPKQQQRCISCGYERGSTDPTRYCGQCGRSYISEPACEQ